MNQEMRRQQDIAEKFKPFEARCEELVYRAHDTGIPDTKFSPREGIDNHWFNHRKGGLVEIDDRYIPYTYPVPGRLSELLFDISCAMQLREMNSRNWKHNLELLTKELTLWIKELKRLGAPNLDLRFLGNVLERLISASLKR